VEKKRVTNTRPLPLPPRASKHSFAHSAVTDGRGGGGQQVHGVRTSQSTNVPRDAVVRCLEARALAFQGLDTAAAQLEPLQLVRYGRGERYHFHTDWFPDPARATAALGGNRLSSFFAYVRASNGTTAGSGPDGDDDSGGGGAGSDERVRGGGTNFPLVDAPRDPRWCDAWVDCDEPWDRGVTFRPVEGNAVYWENMLPDAPGRGDPRTLHAGLPLVSGEKIGLNIWTRQAPLGDDVRGPDV